MANKSRNAARLHRHARVRKKVFGTPERPRLNVFRSISEIYAQVIDDHSGTTLVSASSVDAGLREIVKGKRSEPQRPAPEQPVSDPSKIESALAFISSECGYDDCFI